MENWFIKIRKRKTRFHWNKWTKKTKGTFRGYKRSRSLVNKKDDFEKFLSNASKILQWIFSLPRNWFNPVCFSETMFLSCHVTKASPNKVSFHWPSDRVWKTTALFKLEFHWKVWGKNDDSSNKLVLTNTIRACVDPGETKIPSFFMSCIDSEVESCLTPSSPVSLSCES